MCTPLKDFKLKYKHTCIPLELNRIKNVAFRWALRNDLVEWNNIALDCVRGDIIIIIVIIQNHRIGIINWFIHCYLFFWSWPLKIRRRWLKVANEVRSFLTTTIRDTCIFIWWFFHFVVIIFHENHNTIFIYVVHRLNHV